MTRAALRHRCWDSSVQASRRARQLKEPLPQLPVFQAFCAVRSYEGSSAQSLSRHPAMTKLHAFKKAWYSVTLGFLSFCLVCATLDRPTVMKVGGFGSQTAAVPPRSLSGPCDRDELTWEELSCVIVLCVVRSFSG